MTFKRLATIVSFFGALALLSGCKKEPEIKQVEPIRDVEKKLEEIRPLNCSNTLEHLVLSEDGISVYEGRDESSKSSKVPQNAYLELCSGEIRNGWQLVNYNEQFGWVKQGQKIVSKDTLDNERINIENIIFCDEIIDEGCKGRSDLFSKEDQKTVSFLAHLSYQSYERRELTINGSYQLLSSNGDVVRSGEITLEKELSGHERPSGRVKINDVLNLRGFESDRYTLNIEVEDAYGNSATKSKTFVYNGISIRELKICTANTVGTSNCGDGQNKFLTSFEVTSQGGGEYTETFLRPELHFSFIVDTYQENGQPSVNVSYNCGSTNWRTISANSSDSGKSFSGKILDSGIAYNESDCSIQVSGSNPEFPQIGSATVKEDFAIKGSGVVEVRILGAYGGNMSTLSVGATVYKKEGSDYQRLQRINIRGSTRLNLWPGEYKLKLDPFTCKADKNGPNSVRVPESEETFIAEMGFSGGVKFRFNQCHNM